MGKLSDHFELMKSIEKEAEEIKKKNKEEREAFARNQEDIKNKNAVNHALVKYSNDIASSIDKLNNQDETLKLLNAENKRLDNERIKAEHDPNKYKYLIEYYKRAIKEIEERLKFWKGKKEAEKEKTANAFYFTVPPEIKTEIKEAPAIPKSLVKKKARSNNNVPENFAQIDCSASKKEILFFFMILTKTRNSKGEFYMTKKNVLKFLKKNFLVFNSTQDGNTKFPINLVKEATLTYFIYRFYKNYDNKENLAKGKYVRLMINNFTQFEKKSEDYLSSIMGDSHKPKNKANVIPIDKYFPDKKMM